MKREDSPFYRLLALTAKILVGVVRGGFLLNNSAFDLRVKK